MPYMDELVKLEIHETAKDWRVDKCWAIRSGHSNQEAFDAVIAKQPSAAGTLPLLLIAV